MEIESEVFTDDCDADSISLFRSRVWKHPDMNVWYVTHAIKYEPQPYVNVRVQRCPRWEGGPQEAWLQRVHYNMIEVLGYQYV